MNAQPIESTERDREVAMRLWGGRAEPGWIARTAEALTEARAEGRREVILATTRRVTEGECACVSCVAAELGIQR